MKKVTRLSILILSLSLMLTACVRKVGWVGMNYGGKMKASYRLYDGPQTSTVSLEEGEQINLKYDVVIEAGSLTLTLTNPDQEIIWQEEFESSDSGTFVFEAGQEGRYTLTTDGHKTQGSFDITWDSEE